MAFYPCGWDWLLPGCTRPRKRLLLYHRSPRLLLTTRIMSRRTLLHRIEISFRVQTITLWAHGCLDCSIPIAKYRSIQCCKHRSDRR
ncbi:hypothetical protein BDW68DRAFT_154017 [Aspergillus falconensis]